MLLQARAASFLVVFFYIAAIIAVLIPSLPPAPQFNALMAVFIVVFIIAASLVAALFTFLLLKASELLAGRNLAPRRFVPLVAWKFLRSQQEVHAVATRLRLALRSLAPQTSSWPVRPAVVLVILTGAVAAAAWWSAARLLSSPPSQYLPLVKASIACIAASWLGVRALGAPSCPAAWLLAAAAAGGSAAAAALLFPAAVRISDKVPGPVFVALALVPPLVLTVQFAARAVLALLARSGRLPTSLDPRFSPPIETRIRQGVGASAFASVVGVAVGVWALIVVLSVMSGFSGELKSRIVRTKDHLMVKSVEPGSPLPEPLHLADSIRNLRHVESASPYVEGEAMMSSHVNISSTVTVRGLDHASLEATGVGVALVSGSLYFVEHPEQLVAFPGIHPFLQQPPLQLPGLEPEEATTDQEETETAPGPETSRGLASPPGLAPMPDIPESESSDSQGTPPEPPSPVGLPPLPLSEGWRTVPDQNVLPPVVIGQELARSLSVGVGSRITVISPDGEVGPMGVQPKARAFLVAAIFSTGMYEYDLKLAYMFLPDAQRFFNLGDVVDHVDVRLTDLDASPDVASDVKALVPGESVEVLTWQELNRNLFSALKLERVVMFIVLGLIILIASFNIVSALIILIRRRLAAIAILRTVGAAAADVRSVFLLLGSAAGFFGVVSGVILGLTSCEVVRHLGLTLPREYYIRTLPVVVDPLAVMQVALAALLITALASLYPGRLAARVALVEGLKDER